MNLTQSQMIIVLVLGVVVFLYLTQGNKEHFDADVPSLTPLSQTTTTVTVTTQGTAEPVLTSDATVYQTIPMQQTITGSKLPVSVSAGGLQPAGLEIISNTIPLPYYSQDFTDSWADIQIGESEEGSSGAAISTGQPMPVQIVSSQKMPTYRVNLPSISAPMTIPATSTSIAPGSTIPGGSVSLDSVSGSVSSSAPPVPYTPPEADKAYNKVHGVDWPGNDIHCDMYGDEGVKDFTSCQNKCQTNPKCIGFVDVKPGANEVFPQGFCCAKHTMVDPMATAGVDSYHKMSMSPM